MCLDYATYQMAESEVLLHIFTHPPHIFIHHNVCTNTAIFTRSSFPQHFLTRYVKAASYFLHACFRPVCLIFILIEQNCCRNRRFNICNTGTHQWAPTTDRPIPLILLKPSGHRLLYQCYELSFPSGSYPGSFLSEILVYILVPKSLSHTRSSSALRFHCFMQLV